MCTPEQQKIETLFFEISEGRPQSYKLQENLWQEENHKQSEPYLCPKSKQILSLCTGVFPTDLAVEITMESSKTNHRYQMLHTIGKQISAVRSKQGNCLLEQQQQSCNPQKNKAEYRVTEVYYLQYPIFNEKLPDRKVGSMLMWEWKLGERK